MSIRTTLRTFFPVWAARARSVERAIHRMAVRVYPFDLAFRFSGYTVHYQAGNALVARVRSAGGEFEPRLIAHIIVERLRCVRDPVLLDIGANIGLITLAVIRAVPTTRIYAFEPGPRQAAFLKKTIQKNDLEGSVAVLETAVADSEGETPFFTHEEGSDAKDGLADTGRGSRVRKIEVGVTTLDTWAQHANLSSISVIKIDTEGSELMALRGARDTLKRFRPVIYFELDARNLKPYPYKPEDIVRFFDNEDYFLETLNGVRVSVGNIQENMQNTDTFVAFPRRAV